MSDPADHSSRPNLKITPRAVVGVIVGILLIAFIVLNRQATDVSFVFFETETRLWVALLIAAVAGVLIGLALGRRRYRR